MAFFRYKWGGGRALVAHLFPSTCFSSSAPLLVATTMAPIRRFSAEEKGKAPREELGPLPPNKRLARSHDVVLRPEVTRPWYERPPMIIVNDGFPLHVAGTCQVGQLPRQRGEAETPMSNQPPRVDQGRRLLGLAALHT